MSIIDFLYLWSFVIIIYEVLQVLIPLHKHYWLLSLKSINNFLCSIGMKPFFSTLLLERLWFFCNICQLLTCWLYVFIRHEVFKAFWFLCSISIIFFVHQMWSFKLLVCALFENKELVPDQGALQIDSIIHDQNHVSSSS